MYIPVSEMISRIRTKYEVGAGGSSVRWTDEQLLLFINEGVENVAEATGFYERYCTIPLVPNRNYYDLRGFAPETVISVTSVFSLERNMWLDPISGDSLDSRWLQASGTPLAYWTAGVYWLGLYPCPNDAMTPVTLRVYFKGIPARFTTTQGVIDLPDHFYPTFEDYVLYEMAAADGNTKRALMHWSSYQDRERDIAKLVANRASGAHRGRIGGTAGRI